MILMQKNKHSNDGDIYSKREEFIHKELNILEKSKIKRKIKSIQ